MKSVSQRFKDYVLDGKPVSVEATIVLVDETEISINSSDVLQNGFKLESASSDMSVFQIGAVVISQLTLVLKNFDGRYNDVTFDGAVIKNIRECVTYDDGTVEKIKHQDFYVDSQTYTSGTVTLISLDKLYEYDTEYLGARGYVYSRDIVSYLATKHNMLVLDATNIPNIGYAIPLDMNLTDRQVLSYTAQLICKYVTINDDGYLKLSWYDTNILKNLNDRIDSRTFDNIPDGIISGGTFTNIPTNIVNGGTFADIKNYFRADVLFDPSKVDVDDIVITGVRVVTDSENYAEYGAEGYMLNIKSNPFTDGIEQSVATYIGQIVCGMRFRALDIQTLPIPFVECGDIALVSFRGNAYSTVFTNIVYRNDGHSEYICGAESPGKNSSVRNSEAVTEAVIKSTQNTKKQLSAYDIQMQMLTNLMCNGFGTFKTEEKQSDGSVIYYLHNKPNLSESSTIWKMTSDAFSVSTDGGKTWNAGIDSYGNVIVNVLSAVGINFDWAHGGTLKLGGENNLNGEMKIYDAENNVIFSASKDGISSSVIATKEEVNEAKQTADTANSSAATAQRTATSAVDMVDDNSKKLNNVTGTVRTLSSSVSQLNNLISYTFVDETKQNNEITETLNKYIRFVSNDDGTVAIQLSTSERDSLTLTLINDRIVFTNKNGKELGTFTADELDVLHINIPVGGSVKIGNFAFIPRTNGNLSFKYMK